jgi:tetratricopeptide (TPR) repeat protein
MQARFTADRVQVAGRYSDYVRVSDEGDRRTFHFCPDCGATVFFTTEDAPDLIAVPVGVFADPSFPPPTVSVYESRHPWITLPAAIETDAAWESLRPLYEQGRYAEVADRARELIDANPHFTELLYNVARCESLAGRTADALEHLGRAVDGREQFRTLAAGDSDFDPIRDQPGFRELMG